MQKKSVLGKSMPCNIKSLQKNPSVSHLNKSNFTKDTLSTNKEGDL